MKIKRKVRIVIELLFIGAVGLAVYFNLPKNGTEEVTEVVPVEVERFDKIGERGTRSKLELLQEYKGINDDFLGLLSVGNVISDEIIVMDHNFNEQYITTDFFTGEYASHGTSWMDYRNTLEDQNLILYGHYVYPFRRVEGYPLCFTNLHELKDVKNYEENKLITFDLMDETRFYEVVAVYYYNLNNDIGRYYSTSYKAYEGSYPMSAFMSEVHDLEFYDTGVELTEEDHMMSLQTCVENHDELRLIVIAKEIGRKGYNHQSLKRGSWVK